MADAHYDPHGGLVLRVSNQTRDVIVLALWIGVTFVQFNRDELLLYPLALYYAYAIWRDQRLLVPLLARAWILLVFPTWCVISVLWAVEPMQVIKHAIYLWLTMLICFQVVATMTGRQIMLAILLATGTVGLINFVYAIGPGDIQRGIFDQKNTMGKNMVVLWIIAFAVALDPLANGWARLFAGALAIIAAVMGVASESATAVLLILGSTMLLVVGATILRGGVFRASNLAMLSLVLGLLTLAGAAILPSLTVDPVTAILDSFGKDTTLTGRTILWQYAEEQIAEHPILGVGAGGFWRWHESPLVQKIYFDFYRGPDALFNFHNSAYEIAVHQGLIGLALAGIATLWGVYWITRYGLEVGSLAAIYFFAHMIVVLIRVGTESDFLKPFVLFHMIFWIGALIACKSIGLRQGSTDL